MTQIGTPVKAQMQTKLIHKESKIRRSRCRLFKMAILTDHISVSASIVAGLFKAGKPETGYSSGRLPCVSV